MAIDSLLACPRCDVPLSRPADDLTCAACQVTFPTHDGVPWLFADPMATMRDWHNRWQLAVAQANSSADHLGQASEHAKRDATRQRLQHQGDAKRRYAEQLQRLLEPLALNNNANLESFLALRTRLPTEQGLTSYAANLFRDWCWGDAENATSLRAISAMLNDQRPQKVLVLGAGAGRLAYDVHEALTPQVTLALDNNPLFTNLLARVAAGQSVQLTEFPLAPNKAEDTAIERTLAAPSPATPGFHCVLADGLRAPFLPGSFDLVITPWFVDVVQADAEEVAARVNHLLATGGSWINHGSLTFSGPDPANHLCLAEFIEVITESGFAHNATAEEEVAYLACPQSRHSRRECVATTSATKVADTPQPKRHQSLPEWLVSGREPVPALPQFQSQALSTRIHAFIMSLIDGKRSLKDMATVMEDQQLMTKAEAEQAIRGFLIKMFDEAQRGRGY